MEHKAEFIEKVRSAAELQQESEAKALKKRPSREQKRIKERNTLIKKIYEDNVNGKLSGKRLGSRFISQAIRRIVYIPWR